jgi:hypothetical protein
MSTNTRPVGSSFATLTRAALVVLGAALTWSCGIWLLQLDWYAGPAAQRVNVRWVPDTANDPGKQARAEQALRLTAGEAAGPRTWAYRVVDRSSENIGRILSNPSVEDTQWIDRAELRVQLNQPSIPEWVRELLNTEWASAVGLLLLIAGSVPVWFSRRQIGATPGEVRRLLRTARHVSRAATVPIAARIRAVVLRPAGDAPPPAVPGLQWWELPAGLVTGLLALAPLLTYGPNDAEEVGLGVFSSQVFYRALFAGHWTFWSNDLGFGTPMPIGHSLDFHPAFALGSLVSVWTALCAVWIVQVVAMVVYFLRLEVASGIRAPLRTILLACYVFSMPTVFYLYETDWVALIVPWTLLPAVVFYLRRAALDPDGEWWAMSAARLGLLCGFWFLNSNPAYLAALVFALGVYTLVMSPVRIRLYGCLMSAVVLAAAASAERLWFALDEMRRFPDTHGRATREGYTLAEHAWAAIVPLADPMGQGAMVTSWPRTDIPFVGIVLGVAALALVLKVTRESDRHVRACGITFAVSATLTIANTDMLGPLRVVSAVRQFRDPMVFFALLAGGIALQRALDSFRPRWRTIVWCCVVAQVVQQGIAVRTGFWNITHPGARWQFYRHQFHPVGIGAVITQRAASYGSRLYVSEEILERLRGRLSGEGLHFITDLALLGVNPINGNFKGVSMDPLYPSPALMKGVISGQRDVIANDALLDVLGVNLIMMAAGEGPIPSTLRLTDHLRPHGDVAYAGPAHDILLLANEDAWPKAVLLDSAAQTVPLPFRGGCPNRGALCRDYGALAAARLPEPVQLSVAGGRYTARLAPSDRERLLFLSVLDRPEWQVTARAGPLRIVPIADAFVGVLVPAGVDEVELRFVPRVRIALAWFSGGVLTLLLVGVGAGYARRGRGLVQRSRT